MRPGAPNPNAIRGEIAGLQKQKTQMEAGSGSLESELFKRQQSLQEFQRNRQTLMEKINEMKNALNQVPAGHPQRKQIENALGNYQQQLKKVEDGIGKLRMSIDQIRKNLGTMRERRGKVYSAIQARKRALIQLAAQQMQQKKQQQNQGTSRNREQGKQKG